MDQAAAAALHKTGGGTAPADGLPATCALKWLLSQNIWECQDCILQIYHLGQGKMLDIFKKALMLFQTGIIFFLETSIMTQKHHKIS